LRLFVFVCVICAGVHTEALFGILVVQLDHWFILRLQSTQARTHAHSFFRLGWENVSSCSFLGAFGITYAKVYTYKCRLRMSSTKAWVLWRRASEGREPNVSIQSSTLEFHRLRLFCLTRLPHWPPWQPCPATL
jgi:hypothetical protein